MDRSRHRSQTRDGKVGLTALAAELRKYVGNNMPKDTKFDIVAFSMGGLVCRHYLQKMDGARRVNRFISISTPHHGTWAAQLGWNPGMRDMRPGSDFLTNLNQNTQSLDPISCLSVWTPLDLLILPPNSSKVPFARSRCVFVLLHPLMLSSGQVKGAIRNYLR